MDLSGGKGRMIVRQLYLLWRGFCSDGWMIRAIEVDEIELGFVR